MGFYLRTTEAQNDHDWIVQTAAARLDATKYSVYINPGAQKNTAVGGEYPDIIVTPRGSNAVQFIIEVETEGSVNDSEAEQWKSYSKLGATFYILVPYPSLQAARTICLRQGIRTRFAYYWIDERRQFQIRYE
jgi:hypothetical protein